MPNLYELIKGRNLAVYPDADLRLAVSRCVAVETSRGWRIAKEKVSHEIEAVVALAQAALGAAHDQQHEPAALRWVREQVEALYGENSASRRGGESGTTVTSDSGWTPPGFKPTYRPARAPLPTQPPPPEIEPDEDNEAIMAYLYGDERPPAQSKPRQDRPTVTSDSGWTPPGFRPNRLK